MRNPDFDHADDQDGEDDISNVESRRLSDAELQALGYVTTAEVEARLDEDLEETFPASDPVPINPGSD